MPDIEWFVKRESERATAKGKKLFLHGFSMVRILGIFKPLSGGTDQWRTGCDLNVSVSADL